MPESDLYQVLQWSVKVDDRIEVIGTAIEMG